MRKILLSGSISMLFLAGNALAQVPPRDLSKQLDELHAAKARSAAVESPAAAATPLAIAQLIQDSGFETGTAASGTSMFTALSSPWVVQSNSGFTNLRYYNSSTTAARSGSWCAYFDISNNSTNRLYQTVSIPLATAATLSFWLKVGSGETTTVSAYDTLKVSLTNTSGATLTTLHTYSNLDETAGYTYVQHSFDVSAYMGQTVRVQFDTSLDGTNYTIFMLDDVWLTATTPPPSLCTEDAYTMCLIGGRYRVTSHWRNQYAGGAVANLQKAKLTDAAGAFWISDAASYEYLIRISTTTNNGRAWISIPTFTDVEFWILVEDRIGGQSKEYHSDPGNRTLIYDPLFFVYP